MKKIVLGMTVLGAFMAPMLAFSQEETEVGKLKERLMALEQKIYSGNAGGSSSSGRMMADFEARLGGLEEEAQKVYGAVEELGFTVDEFAKKMDLIAKDFDLRLTDLETMVDDLKVNGVKAKADAMQTPKGQPQKQDMSAKKSASKPVVAKTEVASDIPTDLSAEDMYSKAYHFLVATSYDDAEKWMKEFIKRHPVSELSDNAHYWLGEIYLVKEKPEQAIISFSTGLSKFPKGAKAPSNLLKMGTAFKQMGKKDHAQSSWRKLEVDYPDSPEAEKAKKELEKLAVQN